MLRHSWPAVGAPVLRSLSLFHPLKWWQSKHWQIGSMWESEPPDSCKPLHHHIAPRQLTLHPVYFPVRILPATNATCIDWWFCRTLFIKEKCDPNLERCSRPSHSSWTNKQRGWTFSIFLVQGLNHSSQETSCLTDCSFHAGDDLGRSLQLW